MATRIRRYEDNLNTSNKHIGEWFAQFDLDLLVQGIVIPQVLPETDEAAAREARNNEIVEAERKRTAHFLTSVTSDMFLLLKSLVQPMNIAERTYDQLKKVVTDHLAPKPTVLAQRYAFYKTVQRTDETVADFIARLRTLAIDCAFENFERSLS